MRTFRTIVNLLWDKLLIGCIALYVLMTISPLILPDLGRDSGVFQYIGWRILHGEIPYRDIWDHKPPIIFYINAIGLGISNVSRWGVWFIELIAISAAAFIGYHLSKKIFGSFPAIFSTVLWLLTLIFLLEGGNIPEEYILPLQFLCLWLIRDIDKPEPVNWRYFLIGLTGAIAFFTKQNAIGIWIAVVFYISLQRLSSSQLKRWLHELLLISAGSLVIGVGIILFFGLHSILPQFWSAAFAYNFVYSRLDLPLRSRFTTSIQSIIRLSKTGLFQVSALGYGIALLAVVFKKDAFRKWRLPLITVGLIDLPIEFISINISGKPYVHYSISILPSLSIFAGLMLWVFNSRIKSWKMRHIFRLLCSTWIVASMLSSLYYTYMHIQYSDNPTQEAAVNYIKTNTQSNDYVLLWGAESSVNYLAQRKSPTRFVYQFPLYMRGYVGEKMIEEFLEDVIQNQPRFIVDTSTPQTPFLDFQLNSDMINEDILYLQRHYQMVDKVGTWSIFEYTDKANNP